ncbi:MAG: ferritin family protein [Deltaproteobacteria bacterium]|nr:ferritin family protein [Deltaproteobacteria bacterium]
MDPVHFSAEEILDMAIRIEENGEKFYAAAAKSAKNPKLKELFEFLVKEELKHAAYFGKLKKLVAEYTPHGAADPYLDEASMYIKALSDAKVFHRETDPKELARKTENEEKAIDFAIEAEKESLLFYYEIQKSIRDKDRKIVDDIIIEEKDHLQRLTAIKHEFYGK